MSENLAGFWIPLCVWGLVSALILHLIQMRSILIHGGENKLRLATLAFAAGVILVERLGAQEGRSTSRAYAYALGAVITLFAAYHAYTFRLPVHPLIVFVVNETLFLILWWVGQRVSAACSISSEGTVTAAAESGILRGVALQRKRTEEVQPQAAAAEAQWTEKLSTRHPGRIILWFSLFAIPAFGLGLLVYDRSDPARLQLGALLFLYLWCALALLFLSSLRQLTVYFDQRGVSLPDMVGLAWMAIGFVVVTVALVLGFMLPQPPSMASLFVRSRIVSVYHGWENRHGMKDGAGGEEAGQGTDDEPLSGKNIEGRLNKRYQNIDRLKDPVLSQYARTTGWAEPEYRRAQQLKAAANDGFNQAFGLIVKFLLILACACGVFVLYAMIFVVWNRMAEGVHELRAIRGKKKEPRSARKKKDPKFAAAEPPGRRFSAFNNPFLGASGPLDGDALVRYTWEALLAWCEDAGSPCAPERTPLEFVAARPSALEGFEQPARFIADLFTYSEFSGQPVPNSVVPELKKFWSDLQRHAGQAA